MYTSYDNPGEFFNMSPTTGGISLASATLSFGLADHATSANRFLTNLTAAQADLTTGSTAQVFFGLFDGIYQRLNAIKLADPANKPTKFDLTRYGYTDEATGELVYNYALTIRVNPTGFVAVNS
jgi:hypothetical protein